MSTQKTSTTTVMESVLMMRTVMESVISTRYTDVLIQKQLTTTQKQQRRTELVFMSRWGDVRYHLLVTTTRQLITTYRDLVTSLACLACKKEVEIV